MLKGHCLYVLITTLGHVKLNKLIDTQVIFIVTLKKKRVMMPSDIISAETGGLCKKLMLDFHEIRVDKDSKLTLHGPL
eukprot:13828137-Heterocapsa_arctica.AAC.1